MTIYYIEVGNIFNDETVSTDNYESIDEAYYEAAEIAEEMHNELVDRYGKLKEYDPEAYSIKDDIKYTEHARDAYEYYNHYD